MGIFDRMKDMVGIAPVERVSSVDEATPLDAAIRKVSLDVRRDLLDAPAAAVLTHLGRDGETVAAVPVPGRERGQWMQGRVSDAFVRSRDEMTPRGLTYDPVMIDAIERSVAGIVVSKPDMDRRLSNRVHNERSAATMGVAYFLADGAHLENRVSEESAHLQHRSREEIEDRFSSSPTGRLDAVPDMPSERRVWLQDALRIEHAAAREGLVAPERIVALARLGRGQTPYDLETPIPRVDWKRGAEVRNDVAEEARRSVGIADPGLRSRFRDMPGVADAAIPVMGGPDRQNWVETAMVAQIARGRRRVRLDAPPRAGRGGRSCGPPGEGRSRTPQGRSRAGRPGASAGTDADCASTGGGGGPRQEAPCVRSGQDRVRIQDWRP